MNKSTLFLLLSCFFSLSSKAQTPALSILEVTNEYAVDTMVMDFFNGSCVDVMNIEYAGGGAQAGLFMAQNSALGVSAGILLCTGDIAIAPGPNDADGAGANASGATPDSVFTPLATAPSFDLCKIRMTLVPHTDTLDFEYVFASEEFCEYVNSQFNDVFGFFIQGPGYPTPTNIALVPGTATPVAINNVNHLTNSAYYRHNTDASGNNCDTTPSSSPLVNEIQYDGLTTVLHARATVVQDSAYQVWIGVSDVGDGIFDSGIFLSIESLCGDSLLHPMGNFNALVNGNTVGFQNHTRYATSWNWDFGDGASSSQRNPTHTYSSLNQVYNVRLIASNYCCSDTLYTSVGVSGVQDLASNAFKVYPTLFGAQLNIETQDAAIHNAQLSLTDMSGQVLLQRAFSGRIQLNTTSLLRGVYVLEIRDGEGRKWKQKVIRM